ncbi:hypothetical protein IFM89_020639 [Coptis chinensis]|uniref:Uncharacterized protein n=1 Tax=Coptis chinensis TaxID=261450 RepID=A0A835M0V1_9MAGN|nr:hypothetical protein IFM89_020639 [Coptis chinensis]
MATNRKQHRQVPFDKRCNQDFKQGVNFAVVGATTVDLAFFEEKEVHVYTNYSLGVQIEWLKQLLPSLCASPSYKSNNLELFFFFHHSLTSKQVDRVVG